MILGRFELTTTKNFCLIPKRVKFFAMGTFHFWLRFVFIIWRK